MSTNAPFRCGEAGGALIGTGSVRHARLRPVANRFVYPAWFVLLPMRRLRDRPCPDLPRNRRAPVSFFDADHGDGGPDSLAWAERLLGAEGVVDADGEIWLQCFPRVLGYAFKPVSFWYCHRRGGSLAAVIVEVNNTFGERHCYVLSGAGLCFGSELRVEKAFHVSPFCRVAGDYRFRFMRTGMHPQAPATRSSQVRSVPRIVARIDHHDPDGAVLQTSLSGSLAPLTRERLRAACLAAPLFTVGVVARIHWQALRLWLRRVPFVRKPEPPRAFVTR